MIRIGLVDYYIDEWHAHNFVKRYKDISEGIGIESEVVGAFATLNERNGKRSTDEWCREYGIKKCERIAELQEACDAFIIFAPDDPEVHCALASLVFPFGKPTFIDKTFAASEADARAILALAKKHGARIFSTSALRYADEVIAAKGAREAALCGNYVNIKDYLVHTGEMMITALGTGISTVNCRIKGETYLLGVEYGNGKHASIEMSPLLAFKMNGKPVTSDFFGGQIRDILRFFTGQTPAVAEEETIEVARFIDLAKAAIIQAPQ